MTIDVLITITSQIAFSFLFMKIFNSLQEKYILATETSRLTNKNNKFVAIFIDEYSDKYSGPLCTSQNSILR